MILAVDKYRSNAKRVILGALLLEMFLGGSGRLLEITPFLTVRMVLFFVTLPIGFLFIFVNKKISNNILIPTLVLATLLTSSSIISIINGGSSHLFEDIKPLSSFLSIISLSILITDRHSLEFTKKLFLYSALALAIFHILVYAFLIFNVYDHQQIWFTLSYLSSQDTGPRGGEGEFFFKGSYGFIYYKGDIYMCIGLFFWQHSKFSLWARRIVIAIISIGIFLTGTRGFILVLLIMYGLEWLTKRRPTLHYVAALLGITVIVVAYFLLIPYIGDKEESDLYRYIQIDQVFNQLDIWSLLWGHGFGIGVPVRPIHMEIAYLEMLHKQGIIGLALWFYLLFFIYILYRKVGSTGKSFWQASLFIYLISATNPYVNHPLGITTLIVSIVCLDVLIRTRTRENLPANVFT